MKKALFISFLLAFSVLPGMAQKSEKQKSSPDEEIKVKREYDKDGNLIRFDSLRVFKWSGDSAFSFQFPEGFPSFRFFGEDDFMKDFGLDKDSSFLRNFMFPDDSSFFMGPHSSMMLPPGFFAPDRKGFSDLEQFFGKDFKPLFPDDFLNLPEKTIPEEEFFSPRQKEEWEKMMRRHQQEQEEFFKKWNQTKPGKKIEKM